MHPTSSSSALHKNNPKGIKQKSPQRDFQHLKKQASIVASFSGFYRCITFRVPTCILCTRITSTSSVHRSIMLTNWSCSSQPIAHTRLSSGLLLRLCKKKQTQTELYKLDTYLIASMTHARLRTSKGQVFLYRVMTTASTPSNKIKASCFQSTKLRKKMSNTE